MSDHPPGALLTFDTELFWGLFFLPRFADREAEMGSVRPVLGRILAILDERGIPATFAIVGRLFLEDRDIGDGPLHPDLPDDWSARASEGALATPDAWFGSDLVAAILGSRGEHEVGGHGFVHRDFDALDPAEADRDVAATVKAAAARGVTIRSWVYPRNRVAHEEALARHGIVAWREAPPARSRAGRFLDQLLARGAVAAPARRTAAGLTALPAGVPILPGDGVRRLLTRSRRRALVSRGLENASRRGGLFHLWTHPHNFVRRRDAMLAVLEDAADEMARARDREGVEILTMSAAAARTGGGA